MSRTLTCEVCSNPFEHAGGRGRPPKKCPDCRAKAAEQKPETKKIDPVKGARQTAEAIQAGATFESTAKVKKVNPFVKKHNDKVKMEKARAGKEEKKTENVAEEQARLKRELEELPARIRIAEQRYQLAKDKFSAAQTVEEIEKANVPMEQAQIGLAALYARKRKLEAVKWFDDRGLDASKLMRPAEESEAIVEEVVIDPEGDDQDEQDRQDDLTEKLNQDHKELKELSNTRPLCTDCGEQASDPDFDGDEDFGGLCDDCAEKILAAS